MLVASSKPAADAACEAKTAAANKAVFKGVTADFEITSFIQIPLKIMETKKAAQRRLT